MKLKRCAWPANNAAMIQYHDTEWGVPVHDDRKLFEFMILDAFQAGLNWQIILNKRANFRKAFHNFNARKIAKYTAADVRRLRADAGIIRNRAKIKATISNAKLFLQVKKEFGSFDKYIWQFTGGKPKINKRKTTKQIPATSAFMQAAGMINDHTTECFRYKKLVGRGRTRSTRKKK